MIFITGCEGFIGEKLRSKLLPSREEVDGIDLKHGENILTAFLPHPKRVDTVFHLAAQTSVESSWYDPLHDLDNIRMTARLVHEYPNARIIYSNSAAALPPISSPYGFSKRASADYLKLFHKNYVICTFPNLFGGGKGVVDKFKKSEDVIIYGDGTHTRDYVHVDDIVDGLIKARQWPVGEYQMGSGVATSVKDLAKGKNVRYEPERKEAKESVLRNDTPDWKPTINVYDYLKS